MAAKKFQTEWLKKLAEALLGASPNPQQQAAYSAFGGKRNIDWQYDSEGNPTDFFSIRDPSAFLRKGVKAPSDPNAPLTSDMFDPNVIDTYHKRMQDIEQAQDLSGGVSIPQLGSLAVGAIREHPVKAMGLGALGLGNIGGLTDNDKFGGQLGGLALGGLGAHALASGNPYLQAMLTMGGGELGALFDKLRAKREQERAQMPQARMR